MTAKRKTKQSPSETYAARVARGRTPITVALPAGCIAQLDELAALRGDARWETVSAAIGNLYHAKLGR